MDRIPIHDVAASTASSARSWLQSIDRSKLETSVPTATLILWLETIIQRAPPVQELNTQAERTVMGFYTEASEAIRARDEDQDRVRD